MRPLHGGKHGSEVRDGLPRRTGEEEVQVSGRSARQGTDHSASCKDQARQHETSQLRKQGSTTKRRQPSTEVLGCALELRPSAFAEEERDLEFGCITGRAIAEKNLVEAVVAEALRGVQPPILGTEIEVAGSAAEIELQVRQPKKATLLYQLAFVFLNHVLRGPSTRPHIAEEMLEQVAIAIHEN
jgi:hypothetical protein